MKKISQYIYLDVCALSRPFDEQHYIRIKLETDAVNMILSKVKEGRFNLLVSPVHIKEIAAITDTHERIELQMILDNVGMHVTADIKKTRKRAVELVMLGFGIADAAHVAFAETSSAQFISCDDRLIKKCRDHNINVWCGNPVFFCDKEGLR